ncbi:exodeoxyribonuclease I [Alteromonas flava]|uniref:exodeoxyribonuclease I n=1 Tax=Alteromonas flava TaxID=2048003 RepID=UPI000C292DF6|nr:exodeoxyribonuclease I [Alteromonas flava]
MSTNHTPTLLFHDYETWGADPKRDWPSQFAAIRTDLELKPNAKPLNWFCQIPNDYLPHPQACLITGITPQQSLRDGHREAEFIRLVHAELSKPNTCVVGYNSLRFDDEVSRFSLFRNFYDPYAREWQNGNSRWDLIDLVRACYALRPEGIEWPKKADGSPSFKLEDLAKANQLEHTSAHDALSDVNATIGLARLIKQQQPKLYDYGFSLRNKNTVLARLNVHAQQPLIHISSRFKAKHGCCAIVVPIALHPTNKNAVICINLCEPIDNLFSLSSTEIRELLYTKGDELEHDQTRPALKTIAINRCPFVAPLSTLTETRAESLEIDIPLAKQRLQQILAQPELVQKLLDVFDVEMSAETIDPDCSLYQESFLTNTQKQWCQQIITTPPEGLALLAEQAPNREFRTRLFRYRARNYPTSLSVEEMNQWQSHRQARLVLGEHPGWLSIESFMQELEQLAHEYENDRNKMAILRALADYAQNL